MDKKAKIIVRRYGENFMLCCEATTINNGISFKTRTQETQAKQAEILHSIAHLTDALQPGERLEIKIMQ